MFTLHPEVYHDGFKKGEAIGIGVTVENHVYEMSRGKAKDITWVSKVKPDGKNVRTMKIPSLSALRILNLGFRTDEVEVKADEIVSRLKQRLLELFEQGKLSRDLALQIMDDMESPPTGFKPVWKWMQESFFLNVLKKAKYDLVHQPDEADVYGVLNTRILTNVKN